MTREADEVRQQGFFKMQSIELRVYVPVDTKICQHSSLPVT